MVALDPLLQVLGDVMQRILRQEPVFPGGRDGRRIGAGPVCADPVGREQGLVFQHLAEEALGRLQVALRRQEEVDRVCRACRWPGTGIATGRGSLM